MTAAEKPNQNFIYVCKTKIGEYSSSMGDLHQKRRDPTVKEAIAETIHQIHPTKQQWEIKEQGPTRPLDPSRKKTKEQVTPRR